MASEKPILFSYSFDEENYHGEFETIAEAIAEARDEYPDRDSVWIGEAIRPDPCAFIDGSDVIDQIQGQDEFCGDWASDWPHTSKAQDAELTALLRAAFTLWLDKHDLHPKFWNVENAKKYILGEAQS